MYAFVIVVASLVTFVGCLLLSAIRFQFRSLFGLTLSHRLYTVISTRLHWQRKMQPKNRFKTSADPNRTEMWCVLDTHEYKVHTHTHTLAVSDYIWMSNGKHAQTKYTDLYVCVSCGVKHTRVIWRIYHDVNIKSISFSLAVLFFPLSVRNGIYFRLK